MEQITRCPNCNIELKSSMFTVIKLLSQKEINLINEYHSPKATAYCNKCGDDLYASHSSKAETEFQKLKNELNSIIDFISVITVHHPYNWDYKIVGMVTAQSTTGTGAITEFVTSFTDFAGGQSSRMNNKLKGGERLCFQQLRYNAADLGANAVIGTDIDYTEVGGDKGMLMVCMSGTAIILNNPEILSDKTAEAVKQILIKRKRVNFLSTIMS